ncbi:MAG: thymidylate kinase, partial [Pseudonocardiales bacterium]|nr:thymidylate kinase [Pseudonocardiales bacterium]
GVLIAVEGATAEETAEQAGRLCAALREQGHVVIEPGDGERDQARWAAATREANLSGARAKALAVAAVRADLVERVIRPALAEGFVVVVDRFLASPLAQFGVAAGTVLDPGELESLAAWATGRLRPDITVLLDRAPAAVDPAEPVERRGLVGEEHIRVQRLLTRMAAAEPHRYVVVDAEGSPEVVAARVLTGLAPVCPPPTVRAPDATFREQATVVDPDARAPR